MNIGLVAHDTKKMLMQNFCIAYRGILARNELYATGTTGRLIEEVTNLNIHKFLAGHLGGEQQLGAQIEHNNIDLMIFLRDPYTPSVMSRMPTQLSAYVMHIIFQSQQTWQQQNF